MIQYLLIVFSEVFGGNAAESSKSDVSSERIECIYEIDVA